MQKIFKAIIIIVVLSCFNQTVKAAERLEVVFVKSNGSYYSYESVPILLMSDFTEQQKAYMLFTNLFNKPENQLSAIPKNTELLSATIIDRCLVLEVSEEISNYTGGEVEKLLTQQILKTASHLNISYITLNVSGSAVILPEGSIINMEEINAKTR